MAGETSRLFEFRAADHVGAPLSVDRPRISNASPRISVISYPVYALTRGQWVFRWMAGSNYTVRNQGRWKRRPLIRMCRLRLSGRRQTRLRKNIDARGPRFAVNNFEARTAIVVVHIPEAGFEIVGNGPPGNRMARTWILSIIALPNTLASLLN